MTAITAPQLLTGPDSNTARDRPLIVRLMETLDRLDPERLEQLWNAPSEHGPSGSGGASFELSLIRSGLVDEWQIARAYSEHYLLPFFDPPAELAPPVDNRVSSLLPEELCRQHLIVPLADDGITLDVAVFCPNALSLAQDLQSVCGRHVRPLFASLSMIERLLRLLYGDPPSDRAAHDSPASQTPTAATAPPPPEPLELALEPTAAPRELPPRIPAPPQRHQHQPRPHDQMLLRYLRSLLKQAVETEATDIHIEPSGESYRVRLRVAGTLAEVAPPPADLQPQFVRELKRLAKVDSRNTSRPQEGTIRIRSGQERVCLRLSSCPTVFGERVVIRVSEAGQLPRDLSHIGLDPPQRADLIEALRSPHGLVLVSGPARSGRTATLYSCLSYLNDPHTNICAIESRIELQIAGINQLPTRSPAPRSIVDALRSVLRQDPDVVAVGEIPNRQTAQLCVQTALQGHRVLATLHADDASMAVSRLSMLLGESNFLAEALRLSVSQRLLRRLCTACRVPRDLSRHEAQQHGLRQTDVVYRAGGCPQCRQTGYRGRVAVFEVIPMVGERSELIRAGAPVDVLRRSAMRGGFQLLSAGVAAKVAAGVTSLEEAVRANVNDSRVRACGPDK